MEQTKKTGVLGDVAKGGMSGIATGFCLSDIVKAYRTNQEQGKKKAVVMGVTYCLSILGTYLVKKKSAESFNARVKNVIDEYQN